MSRDFENNINLLKERYPSTAEEIMAVSIPDDRKALVSRSGLPAYQVRRDTTWVTLTSHYDPIREAEQQVAELDIESTQFVFVFGEAGLYHAEAALKQAGKDAKLFVIARDAANLRIVFETRDLRFLLEDDRVGWLISSDVPVLKQAFQKIVAVDVFTVPTFSVIVHPVELDIASKYYVALQTALHSTFMTTLANYNTAGFFEPYWTKNFVSNLPYLLFGHQMHSFEGSWTQKPAVIVGAGPSLNKNIHLLHEFKGKALIICVGTAFRILERNGIVPDLIVSIDGGPANAAHFANSNYNGIPLLMDVYCHKDITQGHVGPKITFSSSDIHAHWWRLLTKDVPMDIFGTGGSAATAAFYFARYIDANPVIMVGEDLSYPHGSRYAKGAIGDNHTVDDLRQWNKRLHEVEDIYGNKVLTTSDYQLYLRIFQEEALKADRTYINATEGGALKEGYIIKLLRECLEIDCNVNQPVEDWKRNLYQVREIDEAIVTRVSSNIRRSKRELKAVSRYLNYIVELCKAALDEMDHSETGSYNIQRIALETEKMLLKVKKLPYAMAFLDACSFTAIVTDIRLSESIESNQDERGKQQAKLRVLQSMRLFHKLHEKAVDSLESHDHGLEALHVISDTGEGEST